MTEEALRQRLEALYERIAELEAERADMRRKLDASQGEVRRLREKITEILGVRP